MDKSAIVRKNHDLWRAHPELAPLGWEDNTRGEKPGKAPRKPLIKKREKKVIPPPPEPEPIPEPEPEVIEEEAPSEAMIECPFCEREYKTERGYEEHLKRKHPEEV